MTDKQELLRKRKELKTALANYTLLKIYLLRVLSFLVKYSENTFKKLDKLEETYSKMIEVKKSLLSKGFPEEFLEEISKVSCDLDQDFFKTRFSTFHKTFDKQKSC